MRKNYFSFSDSLLDISQDSESETHRKTSAKTKSIYSFLSAAVFAFMFFSAQSFAQCTDAPLIAGTSNITDTSGIVHWVDVSGEATPTYTLEVYTDAAYTNLYDDYTGISDTYYSVTGLTEGTEYFYRVKVDNTTCGDYGEGSFTAQLSYTPLDVTGYNEDVIANGVGIASGSTTSSVDNSVNGGANFAYMSLDYKLNSGSADLTYGLPVDRSLTSPTNSNVKYILNNYSGNNSLRLPNQNDFGVLTLTEPVSLSEVYLAVSSGDGSSVISVEVQFTDSSVQEVTGLNVINWDSGATTETPAIITNIGRVKRTTGITSTGNFKLFQIMIPVELENQSKLVSGIKVTKTDIGSESKIPNIFAVSGTLVSTCPSLSAVSADAVSQTSAEFSWELGSQGEATGDVTYTLEVYTDAAYTAPVTGSPFTGITETSYAVEDLTLDAEYFYRVKANNGNCDSEYLDSSFILGYCITEKTGPYTSYAITNVATEDGYTNIDNATGNDADEQYTNYSDTQIVSKPAGTTFSYSITRSSVYATIGAWVDWNNDLDFDDEGEEIVISQGGWNSNITVNGEITIPADAALGNYRLRVRSTYYWNTTIVPCGPLTYGEGEDYTIAVVEQPGDCDTPDAPTLALSDITVSEITGTVTPAGDSPSGYILIRSTSASLTEEPATGASYSLGAAFGGGTVVATGESITTFTHFLAANTHYYYYLYAYNEGGTECFGPAYSTAATADAITCAKAVVNAGASNITATSAYLNWSSVAGEGGSEPTYTVELYSDEALTEVVETYTTNDAGYALNDLEIGATYYYRVKAEAGDCGDDSWSATASFTAEIGYTPLTVTGFNADVIANGTGIANVSTTNAVDAVDNSYIALDYENVSGSVTTIGLPLNRMLTSNVNTNIDFLLADYTGNNSLRLPAQNQSGTLTLTEPVQASSVYLAVTSGSGSSNINVEISFDDSTTQIAAGISVADWYNAGTGTQPALISGIGRANRSNTTGNVEAGNSKIFYITVNIDEDNQSKTITSIAITKSSTGTTEPVPNIFAVSAYTLGCPSLAGLSAEATGDGAMFSFGESGIWDAPDYSIAVYTDSEMTTEVAGSPFTATGAEYTLDGLSALTTYYYNVEAVTDFCTEDMAGEFTTLCLAPDAPLAEPQVFCGAAVLTDLSATGEDGATLNWYATADSEDTLGDDTALETGSYFVSQDTGGCESERTEVAVTVNVTAMPTSEAQSLCNGAVVSDLIAIGEVGATLNWYATVDAGETLGDETALETGSYFVSQTVEGCESERVEVAVTVNVTPVPAAAGIQSVCGEGTIADLVADSVEGATLNWYATADSEDTLGAETTLETGSYFVSESLEGCESDRVEVSVTVNVIPDAPTGDDLQVFVAGETIADLDIIVTDGAVVNWYVMNESEELVAVDASTELENDVTYYVSQTVAGCESEVFAIVAEITADAASFSIADLKVYPNPANNIVTIAGKQVIENIEIANMLGQKVLSQKVNADNVQVDVSTLAAGTYILNVYADGAAASVKLVKKN